jgi:hypothetical protein
MMISPEILLIFLLLLLFLPTLATFSVSSRPHSELPSFLRKKQRQCLNMEVSVSLPSISLRQRNLLFISTLTKKNTVVMEIFENSTALDSLDLEERSKSLRETVGLTRTNLKLYLTRYPALALQVTT